MSITRSASEEAKQGVDAERKSHFALHCLLHGPKRALELWCQNGVSAPSFYAVAISVIKMQIHTSKSAPNTFPIVHPSSWSQGNEAEQGQKCTVLQAAGHASASVPACPDRVPRVHQRRRLCSIDNPERLFWCGHTLAHMQNLSRESRFIVWYTSITCTWTQVGELASVRRAC